MSQQDPPILEWLPYRPIIITAQSY